VRQEDAGAGGRALPVHPGKVKIERAGSAMNRQLHRCFASIWALFLLAMTASYLSFHSFVDTYSK
jgi:UDP-glucuronate 4-epimerase